MYQPDDRYSARKQRDEAVEDAKHARAQLAKRREEIGARNTDITDAELAELKHLKEQHERLNALAEELTAQVQSEFSPKVKSFPVARARALPASGRAVRRPWP